MVDREGIGEEVANAEPSCAVSKKGVNPVTNVGWEAPSVEDVGELGGVEVVVKPQDVKEEQSSHIVGGTCGLDAMDKDCHCIYGSVVGP